MVTQLVFKSGLVKSSPQKTPVVIVGQLKHLAQLKFNDVKVKLEPCVTEDVFQASVASLHPSPTDSCSMYMNLATVAALPLKCSRHNTSSRAHALTRLVQSCTAGNGTDESIVVVCERPDVYASACAVAKAFPLYTRKTGGISSRDLSITISVEFLLVTTTLRNSSGTTTAAAEIGADNTTHSELTNDDLALLTDAAQSVRTTARIVDMPCNEMNVDGFLKELQLVATTLKLEPKIIRGEELAARGFGGIYGVGKAAIVPPALAVLSYMPQGAHTTIAWVGKGIVYDTGGLSIKGKTAMPGMKRDCGGAAAILGAFYTAVRASFTQNLHAVFCLAENSVGSKATRPDDIHTLYSGRTVEINNTDAEGRLVLADGVAYAHKDLKATIIVDVATLTGAQGIATGKYHGACLSNHGDWEQWAMKAGQASGDLLFPIPYTPELHFTEFSSAIADMKNSVADRSNAQSSCAGLFIMAHLGFDFPGVWLHIDMATPVHVGERATGYGVALLTTLFGKYTKQPLLRLIGPEGVDIAKDSNTCKKPRKN